ncbi:hypothetical protein D9M71_810730 [compost metagenome]
MRRVAPVFSERIDRSSVPLAVERLMAGTPAASRKLIFWPFQTAASLASCSRTSGKPNFGIWSRSPISTVERMLSMRVL